MKRILYILFLIITPVIMLISCSGSGSEEEIDLDSVFLSVSKSSIAANGSDGAILTVTRGGEDITSGSVIEIIAIDGIELDTPTKLSRGATEFSTVTPGKYTLRGSYFEGGTVYSNNTIDVTATEVNYGKYHRKMLAMQFTSIGCVNCPELSTIIKSFMSNDEYKNKLVPVSFHMDFNGPDPMTFKYTVTYMNLFAQQGLPAFYLDFRKDANAPCKLPDLTALVNKIYSEGITTCGVAIESVYDQSTRKLEVSAKVTSEFDNSKLKTIVYLKENDIRYTQSGTTGLEPYYHQNVVRDLLSNSYYGDKLNQVTANTEKTVKYYSTIDPSWDSSKMKIVVCVMATNDGGTSYYVTNAAECDLGSSVDYLYNN